jgi:hypothetical protein
MMKLKEALSAKGVAAVDEYSRNFLTNIEQIPTEIAVVKASSFVICLNQITFMLLIFLLS